MIPLLAILTLGTFLRFYHNTSIALWHDEAFSVLYLRYPWGEMLHRIILDVHPPLYYILLRVWNYVFGSSLLAFRGFSIFFGVAAIYAGYLLVYQAFKNRKWALYTTLLLAINPFQIQYALEARMYTLGTFLILISSNFLLKALETNQRKYWIWYGVAACACLYTHYYLFFSVAAQVLYLIYHLIKTEGFRISVVKSKQFLNAALAGAIMVILYLPWLPSFIEQNQRVQQAFWIPKLAGWSIPSAVYKMLFGEPGSSTRIHIIVLIVSLLIVYYFFKKNKQPVKWFFLAGLFVPFIGSILLSIKTAIFLERYFVFASLFLSMVLGLAIAQIPKYSWRRALATITVVISLAVFFKNWERLGTDNPGMAKAAEVINEQATDEDKIYIGSSFVFFNFKYYNRTPIHPLLYSPGPLETIPHFSGTAILTNDDLILDFKQAKKNDRVWLIWTTGFNSGKPNVPGNWSLVSENEFQDTPAFKGRVIVTQYHVN